MKATPTQLKKLIKSMLKTIEDLGYGGRYARIDARAWFSYYEKKLKKLGLISLLVLTLQGCATREPWTYGNCPVCGEQANKCAAILSDRSGHKWNSGTAYWNYKEIIK